MSDHVVPLRVYFAVFTALLVLTWLTVAAARFDFEGEVVGTEFGPGNGDSPGDQILTQDGIILTLENFDNGVGTGFNGATIKGHPGPPTSEFPITENATNVLGTNNINAKFDFSGVGFPVTKVTIDFADQGGTENFDVNDIGLQVLGDLTSVVDPAGFMVTVNVNEIDNTDVGTVEVMALPGNTIQSFTIGGQEFAIDNLVAIPEPTSAAGVLACLAMFALRRRR